MARQDYILNAIKDLKAHVEKLDDKVDQKLSNIEEKLHKQELIAEKQSQNLEVNNEQLKVHMKRTEVAEQRQDMAEAALEKISGRVEHLEQIASTMNSKHSEAMEKLNQFSTWILKQQERANGVKLFWASCFTWLRRFTVILGVPAAAYGLYEIFEKVFSK